MTQAEKYREMADELETKSWRPLRLETYYVAAPEEIELYQTVNGYDADEWCEENIKKELSFRTKTEAIACSEFMIAAWKNRYEDLKRKEDNEYIKHVPIDYKKINKLFGV